MDMDFRFSGLHLLSLKSVEPWRRLRFIHFKLPSLYKLAPLRTVQMFQLRTSSRHLYLTMEG